MAKRVVRQEGFFPDPYEAVRKTKNDPAREHDPSLIRNTTEVGCIVVIQEPSVRPSVPTDEQSQPATGKRRRRRSS
jgi:hypothetical protein